MHPVLICLCAGHRPSTHETHEITFWCFSFIAQSPPIAIETDSSFSSIWRHSGHRALLPFLAKAGLNSMWQPPEPHMLNPTEGQHTHWYQTIWKGGSQHDYASPEKVDPITCRPSKPNSKITSFPARLPEGFML